MSPLKVQQAIWTHPVLLMQHLGIKTPKQLDQTSGRHHYIWGWQCTKRIISPEDFNICLKCEDIKPDCHSLLSLWVLYWARSCSKSSLMASGQRPATSLMALILEDKKDFNIQWFFFSGKRKAASYPTVMTSPEFLSVTKLLAMVMMTGSMICRMKKTQERGYEGEPLPHIMFADIETLHLVGRAGGKTERHTGESLSPL